jgi:hypothetical protein
MTASHAENHDRDKLGRWHKDLVSGEAGKFPAYAVFLVSREDRAAHDVFRAFRSSFEARGAGFEHLVIFGQHGVSSTLLRLLSQFGLTDEEVPMLAIFSDPQAEAVHTVALSPGEPAETTRSSTPPDAWQAILGQVERTADGEAPSLELESLPVTVDRHDVEGPVLEVVTKLMRELS